MTGLPHRRQIRACLAGLLVVLLLSAVPARAGATTRTFTVTYSGSQTESYSASDNTCCDLQRAGYVGCDYAQDGDLNVHWRVAWAVTADVFPRSGHVKIRSIKRQSGPRDRKNPGDSEISGHTSNGQGNTQCSGAKLAGTYDCTAEAVVPQSPTAPLFSPEKKAFRLDVFGYGTLSAQYTGAAPAGLPCAGAIGTNAFPGGFVGLDFLGLPSDSRHLLPYSQLLSLRIRQSLRAEALKTSSGAGWLVPDFPKAGEACSGLIEGDDESCHYDSGAAAPKRTATLVIQRVR